MDSLSEDVFDINKEDSLEGKSKDTSSIGIDEEPKKEIIKIFPKGDFEDVSNDYEAKIVPLVPDKRLREKYDEKEEVKHEPVEVSEETGEN